MFWSNSFCKNYKRITLQSKFLGLFSCKKGHTCGSNITKKILWLNYFCNNYKNITKENVSRNYFVIISARMVNINNPPGTVPGLGGGPICLCAALLLGATGNTETQQKGIYPYPLGAGSARPNPEKGAPDTENPSCIGSTVLRGGVRPWSQTMVSIPLWGRKP